MFLLGRELTVQKFPAVICPECGTQAPREVVISRMTAQKDHLFCANCGYRIFFGPAPAEKK